MKKRWKDERAERWIEGWTEFQVNTTEKRETILAKKKYIYMEADYNPDGPDIEYDWNMTLCH